MAQVGNSQNCKLNKEWAKHVRRFMKRLTSKKRRSQGKRTIKRLQEEN